MIDINQGIGTNPDVDALGDRRVTSYRDPLQTGADVPGIGPDLGEGSQELHNPGCCLAILARIETPFAASALPSIRLPEAAGRG